MKIAAYLCLNREFIILDDTAFTETHNVCVYTFFSFLILNESTLLGLHSQIKYMKIEVLLLSHAPNGVLLEKIVFLSRCYFLVLLTGFLSSPFCDDFL